MELKFKMAISISYNSLRRDVWSQKLLMQFTQRFWLVEFLNVPIIMILKNDSKD